MAINDQRRTGTGFTNLQRLMQANVGNRLGQAVGQGIQQVGQQAKTGLTQAESKFREDAEKGRLGTEAEKERVENVLGAPEQATEQDVQEFGRFRAGAFTGPREIQNVETLRGQAREAEQLGRSIGSTGGRQGLLQRFAAGPGQYGAGAQKLDTLLLGAGSGDQLREAGRSVRGLGKQTDVRAQAAQEVAKQFENEARGFGQQVTQRTGALAGETLGTAEERAKQAAETNRLLRERSERERQSAVSNQLTQEALDALGLQAGQRTYGVNLGEYLGYEGPGIEPPTAGQVMTQPEFQRYSNLRRLMGQEIGVKSEEVGTYQPGKQTFNKEAAQQAIEQAKAPIESIREDAEQIQRLGQYNPAYTSKDYADAQALGVPVQHLLYYKTTGKYGINQRDWPNLYTSLINKYNQETQKQPSIELLSQEQKQPVSPETVFNPDLGLENMPKVT